MYIYKKFAIYLAFFSIASCVVRFAPKDGNTKGMKPSNLIKIENCTILIFVSPVLKNDSSAINVLLRFEYDRKMSNKLPFSVSNITLELSDKKNSKYICSDPIGYYEIVLGTPKKLGSYTDSTLKKNAFKIYPDSLNYHEFRFRFTGKSHIPNIINASLKLDFSNYQAKQTIQKTVIFKKDRELALN